MSHTPIRQTLARLKSEGLLEEQISKRNYHVSTITKENIQDLFDFREGIETTASMFPQRNKTIPEQLENFQEIIDKMKETKDIGQTRKHFPYDQQFHNGLVALSDNKRLIKVHDGILLRLTRMRFLSFLENSLQSKAYMKRQAIVDAVKDQDYECGHQVVVDHARSSRDDHISPLGNGLSASSPCLLRCLTRNPEADSKEDEQERAMKL